MLIRRREGFNRVQQLMLRLAGNLFGERFQFAAMVDIMLQHITQNGDGLLFGRGAVRVVVRFAVVMRVRMRMGMRMLHPVMRMGMRVFVFVLETHNHHPAGRFAVRADRAESAWKAAAFHKIASIGSVRGDPVFARDVPLRFRIVYWDKPSLV